MKLEANFLNGAIPIHPPQPSPPKAGLHLMHGAIVSCLDICLCGSLWLTAGHSHARASPKSHFCSRS